MYSYKVQNINNGDKDKRIKTYIKTIKILNIFFARLFDKEYFQ